MFNVYFNYIYVYLLTFITQCIILRLETNSVGEFSPRNKKRRNPL
jgi:hypothetical protein